MIEYNCKVVGEKIVDSFKHSNTSMSEISNLTFLLHKKINELCELDSTSQIKIKYPIDKEGNPAEEDEEK